MTDPFFKVDISDYVANVSFNRPDKYNALHDQAWIDMKSIFDQLSEDPSVRVVILTGNGKHFCSGIDLELLMGVSQYAQISCEGVKREKIRAFILRLQGAITAIEKCRKPVIVAVHGACIGGAVDIISACDIRYCSSDAYFAIKEVDLGLVADIGTLQRLPKIIAPGIMAELAFTGRKFDGAEAKEIGFVNQCYATPSDMMADVRRIAGEIASKSPMVIRGTKEIMRYTRDHSVEESLEYMALYNSAFLLTDDLNEAFKAQLTKQAPIFKDS